MDNQICSDEELFLRYHEGSSSSFERLVSRYEREVFSLALYLSGSATDAEEITSKVFLAFCSDRLPLPAVAGDFGANLYAETIRLATEVLELRAFGPLRVVKEESDETARISAAVLEKSIQRLPFEYRKVFVLRDVLAVNIENIGRILDLTPIQVKGRLQRARLMIRRSLLGEMSGLQVDTPEIGETEAMQTETFL